MILINKVTTKTGDKGMTLGPKMLQYKKSDANIEFLGKLDELNTSIGEVLLYENDALLEEVQHQLFDIGGFFYKNELQNIDYFIMFLEKIIAQEVENLPALDSFLLPKGSALTIALHKARCIARSAERVFFSINCEDVAPIGVYLNRLSDLLFVKIRKISSEKWIPLIKRKNFE
jgi:cob(I)alamin adenosyltransferase